MKPNKRFFSAFLLFAFFLLFFTASSNVDPSQSQKYQKSEQADYTNPFTSKVWKA